MTLLELVTHLRESILDDTGGSGVVWADITQDTEDVYQLRWSNEELTRLINQAEKDACRAADLIKSTLDPTFDITVVTGTPVYSIDTRIYKVKQAYLASTEKFLYEADLEDLVIWGNITKAQTPDYFIHDGDVHSLRLYPVPIIDDTVSLIGYRYPLVDYDWEQAETQTSELRDEHQIPMLWQAAYYAYQKDEANTFDPNRAEYFRNKFNQQFTPESGYVETRRSRSRGRTIRYRDVL